MSKPQMLRSRFDRLDRNQYDELRQSVYKIADAYQALMQLQKDGVDMPDLDRLVSNLRDIDDGALGYFTQNL